MWVPADDQHAIRFVGRSSLRTLYFRPDVRSRFPVGCCSLSVSSLLRELVVRTVEIAMLDGRDQTDAALATLLAVELGRGGPPPFVLPEPLSDAIRRAARLISVYQADAGGPVQVARAVGIGVRTLERRFRAETGLTPRRWRQQAKLLKGVELIASGALVKTAAAKAGFASASAYVAAFGRYSAPRRHAISLKLDNGSLHQTSRGGHAAASWREAAVAREATQTRSPRGYRGVLCAGVAAAIFEEDAAAYGGLACHARRR